MQLRVEPRMSGFTLVELMIVVGIATILVAIAVPNYLAQVRQSRRTEAKTALLDLAGREESFYSTNGSLYTAAAAALGYAAMPFQTNSGYYQVRVSCVAAAGNALACDPNANAPAGPSYYLTATPLGSQVNDAQCTSFSVDSLVNQFTTGTLGAQQCWAN